VIYSARDRNDNGVFRFALTALVFNQTRDPKELILITCFHLRNHRDFLFRIEVAEALSPLRRGAKGR